MTLSKKGLVNGNMTTTDAYDSYDTLTSPEDIASQIVGNNSNNVNKIIIASQIVGNNSNNVNKIIIMKWIET